MGLVDGANGAACEGVGRQGGGLEKPIAAGSRRREVFPDGVMVGGIEIAQQQGAGCKLELEHRHLRPVRLDERSELPHQEPARLRVAPEQALGHRADGGRLHPAFGLGRGHQPQNLPKRVPALGQAPRGTERAGQSEQEVQPPQTDRLPMGKQPERRLQPVRRRGRCPRHGDVRCLDEQRDGLLLPGTGSPLDVRGAGHDRGAACRKGVCGSGVRSQPPACSCRRVDDVAYQRMPVAELPGGARLSHQVTAEQFVDHHQHLGLAEPGHLGHQLRIEGVAGHGRRPRHQPRGIGYGIELSAKSRPHGVRHFVGLRRAAAGCAQPVDIPPESGESLEIEGVATARLIDGLAPGSAGPRTQQLIGLLEAQWIQFEVPSQAFADSHRQC